MPSPRVLLLGRPSCHLCEVAREVVVRVCDELGVSWEERSIAGDADLEHRYGERIPVTVVDGHEHDILRVDEARLRTTLATGPFEHGQTTTV